MYYPESVNNSRKVTIMIDYEEELKKFHPSMDVNEAEDAIYSRDLTDMTDILKELLSEEKEKGKR